MRRDQAIEILRQHAQELSKFRVYRLSLFGSVAQDTARANSDVDLLVAFEDRITFARYEDMVSVERLMELNRYLETLLNCRVDLITESALEDEMWDEIEQDIVCVINHNSGK